MRRHLGEQREVAVAVLLCDGSWLLQRKLQFGQRRDARGSVVGHRLRAVYHRRRLGLARMPSAAAGVAPKPPARRESGLSAAMNLSMTAAKPACPANLRGEFVFTLSA